MKKIIPALALLLISAMVLASASYAWFSMNRTVTATGMQVKAVAEDGIVITNTTQANWAASSDAVNDAAELRPTSAATVAAPVWVHAKSTDANSAQASQTVGDYTALTIAWSDATNSEGIGYVEKSSPANTAYNDGVDEAYVLMNNFFIRSSSDDLTAALYINDVEVTSSAAGGAFNKIDNALRVLIVLTESDDTTHAFTFAPVLNQASGTTTTSYTWKATTAVKARFVGGTGDFVAQDVDTGIGTIPSAVDDAINVKIYMYFEGEDANLTSTNISGLTMNDLSLTVRFGLDPLHA